MACSAAQIAEARGIIHNSRLVHTAMPARKKYTASRTCTTLYDVMRHRSAYFEIDASRNLQESLVGEAQNKS